MRRNANMSKYWKVRVFTYTLFYFSEWLVITSLVSLSTFTYQIDVVPFSFLEAIFEIIKVCKGHENAIWMIWNWQNFPLMGTEKEQKLPVSLAVLLTLQVIKVSTQILGWFCSPLKFCSRDWGVSLYSCVNNYVTIWHRWEAGLRNLNLWREE